MCKSLIPSFAARQILNPRKIAGNFNLSRSLAAQAQRQLQQQHSVPFVQVFFWGQSYLTYLLKPLFPPSSWVHLLNILHDGRRPHEISPSQPLILPQTSTPPKPRNLSLHLRTYSNNMAESKRGTAISGEAHHDGQEEYGG